MVSVKEFEMLLLTMQARTIAGIAEQVAGGQQDTGNGSLGRPSSAKDRSVDAGSIPASHDEASLESGVPASYSQEMLIFNNELDPFNPAHNEPFWVKINGRLSGESYAGCENSSQSKPIQTNAFTLNRLIVLNNVTLLTTCSLVLS